MKLLCEIERQHSRKILFETKVMRTSAINLWPLQWKINRPLQLSWTLLQSTCIQFFVSFTDASINHKKMSSTQMNTTIPIYTWQGSISTMQGKGIKHYKPYFIKWKVLMDKRFPRDSEIEETLSLWNSKNKGHASVSWNLEKATYFA